MAIPDHRGETTATRKPETGGFYRIRQILRELGLSRDRLILDPSPDDLLTYYHTGTRRRHTPIIRAFLMVQPYDSVARILIAAVLCAAALTREDLADFINVAIGKVIRKHYELPGFTTPLKETRRARAEVNRDLYSDPGRGHRPVREDAQTS